MNEFQIGGFAVSAAGHDAEKSYVIIQMDKEYVYLVDGRIRTLDRPKKKKKIHVKMLAQSDQNLSEKVINYLVKDEEIKRAIKMVKSVNSSKEVNNVKDRCC